MGRSALSVLNKHKENCEIDISPERIELNKLIRDYCSKNEIDYEKAWFFLYQKICDRRGEDFFAGAKRNGISIILYLELRGLLKYTLEVAKEYFVDNEE